MPLTIETWFDKLTSYVFIKRKNYLRKGMASDFDYLASDLGTESLRSRRFRSNQKEMIQIQEHFSYILAG